MKKLYLHVTLKKDVLDPQGKTIQIALNNLGYKSISEIRQGKFFEVNINTTSDSKALKDTKEIAEKMLSNSVIEDYFISKDIN